MKKNILHLFNKKKKNQCLIKFNNKRYIYINKNYLLRYRMPDKVIVLNEGPPWGFRMTGGKNAGSPLKISRVIFVF